MKHKISIVLLFALISTLSFQTAGASQSALQPYFADFPPGTTIFVDLSNNSGIEDGTAAHPFNTIQEGIDAAVSADVVGVATGTYFENVILTEGIQLIGAERTSTIIDGGGSGTVVIAENASLLMGFTIQHGSASFGAGIVTSGSPTISDNIIRNNTQGGGGAGAAIHGNCSSPTITSNLITENTADTQFLSGAVAFINCSSPYIANNVIWNNTGRGAINLTLPTGNAPMVLNNTIFSNSGAGIKIDSRVNQSAVIIANNILSGNTTGIQIDFGTVEDLPTLVYNDVFGNSVNYSGMPDITGVNGNVSVDPLFSDEFHLDGNSPLIDAGSPTIYPNSDFDGESRPIDSNGDGTAVSEIGADEVIFIPPTPTCNGQTATIYVNTQGMIVGGPKNGLIYQGNLPGTAAADVIVGTSGKDEVSARGGSDVVCGGGSNDKLDGGAGIDQLFGEDGNDILVGEGGNDTLTGGLGADQFRGSGGNDTATDFTPAQGDTKTGVENF